MAFQLVDQWSGSKIIATISEEVLPCTPGKTKCIGPDLYGCNELGQWVLVERNAAKCVAKPFQWLWVGIAAAALGGLILLAPKEKKA